MEIRFELTPDDFIETIYCDDDYGKSEVDTSRIMFDIITDKAAEYLVYNLSRDNCKNMMDYVWQKTYEMTEQIENNVKRQLSDSIQLDEIKDEITAKVVEYLSEKYERTKACMEIRKEFNIKSDTDNKQAIRELISDIVKNEVKKIIKL